jgi:large exoprotein involved in heme utilization and adhesion
LMDAASQLPQRCAVRLPGNTSSFVSTGTGGLPPSPEEAQPSYQLFDLP